MTWVAPGAGTAGDTSRVRIECIVCGLIGPWGDDRKEAAEAWNKMLRAYTQEKGTVARFLAALNKVPATEISDGYHTMAELYEHRHALWIALTRLWSRVALVEPVVTERCWRSKKHSDGSSFDGWFLLGIGTTPGKQMTYHLPNILWDECSHAETLEQAPFFDGHTSVDVLERLRRIHP